jgi:hypothetical protein
VIVVEFLILDSIRDTCVDETPHSNVWTSLENLISERYVTLENGGTLAKNSWYKKPKYLGALTLVVPLVAAMIMILPGILYPQSTSSPAINNSPLMNVDNNIKVIPIINNNQNIITNAGSSPAIAPPNRPPSIDVLDSAPSSPQTAGTKIIWTTDASDPDNDKIYYQYHLNGIPVTDWGRHNEWTWSTSEENIGNNIIEVLVRDKNHAGQSGSDDHKSASFIISNTMPVTKIPGSAVKITSPSNEANVSTPVNIEGTISVNIPDGQYIWILVNPKNNANEYWPQGKDHIHPVNGGWNGTAQLGGTNNSGDKFNILVALVDATTDQDFHNWFDQSEQTHTTPSIILPETARLLNQITVIKK